jgi:hypothetical protein
VSAKAGDLPSIRTANRMSRAVISMRLLADIVEPLDGG